MIRSFQPYMRLSKKYIRSFAESIQLIEGYATPQATKDFCTQFCSKRPVSLITKQGLSVSSLGYGTGNVRLYEDNWSGLLQKVVNTGCNVLQMDIKEKNLKENIEGINYESVGNILNGIVYSANMKRESFLIQGRIFTHDNHGNPYNPKQIQKQIQLLLNNYNITTLDSITLQMPPFITDSQFVLLLSIVQRFIRNKQVRGFIIGCNSIDINDFYKFNHYNQNNITLYKLIKIASDLHILDSFLGVQIPLNLLEHLFLQDLQILNPDPDAFESLTIFDEFLYHSRIQDHMNFISICEALDLNLFIDRGFETSGYHKIYDPKTNNYKESYRPTRFFEVQEQDTKNLNEELQECISICSYMENVYNEELIKKYKDQDSNLPGSISFTKTVIESLTGLNNLCIFEDIQTQKLIPQLRELITGLCECEDLKKWAFAYRLSIQSLMNLYKTAYKGHEYLFLQKFITQLDTLSPKLQIYKNSIYQRVLELYLSSVPNSIVYTDNYYIHENGISSTRLLDSQEAREVLMKSTFPEDI